MNKSSKWRITKQKHDEAFLLGANFNTNTAYGQRESYLIIYLGKCSFVIGRYV